MSKKQYIATDYPDYPDKNKFILFNLHKKLPRVDLNLCKFVKFVAILRYSLAELLQIQISL
jgi:hypothetical protein